MEQKELGMLLIQAIIVGMVVTGVLGFILRKFLKGTVSEMKGRLDRDHQKNVEQQKELNEKIKQANEELNRRRREADALVAKMKDDAEERAKGEREKIIKKAREDSEEIISKAQKTRDDMRKALERDIHLKAVDFTQLLLEEILVEKTMAAFHEGLIADFLASLEGIDMEMVGEDVTTAQITSAGPFDTKFQTQLSQILQKKLGRTLEVQVEQDKSLLAGVTLRFGNLTLNGGLKSMLLEQGEAMKEKLEKGMLTL